MEVIANHSKRIFTIHRKHEKGKTYVKYRTTQMSKEEFKENCLNTLKDWGDYLKTGVYYIV